MQRFLALAQCGGSVHCGEGRFQHSNNTLPCCSLLPKLEELLQSEVSHVMEPISIVGLVDASVDLVLKCASAVKKINDLASKYKSSALALRSIAQNLDTMQFAWDKIGAWTESYTPEENVDDDGFVVRMARFLETGTLVMDALEQELLPFSDETPGIAQRAKLVWNETAFSDHQSRIRDQAISMGLLLQAIQL